MGRVDPHDDRVRRFIVHHYRYDPVRHERRHVVVAAFDNQREFEACMDRAEAELRAHKQGGDDVHPSAHISGVEHEPGHDRKQQNARLVQRAMRHGMLPASIERLELPSNFALLRAGRQPKQPRPPRRNRLARWLRARVKRHLAQHGPR